MPARDIYHNHVKNALIKDHFQITHDPLHLKYGGKDMYVDLAAEQLLAAEKNSHKVAIEIKSFRGHSEIDDLEGALGQYFLYHAILAKVEPDRTLYLAIREDVFVNLFEEAIGQLLFETYPLHIVTFEPETEVIIRWIP